jgi:hypothetical protein
MMGAVCMILRTVKGSSRGLTGIIRALTSISRTLNSIFRTLTSIIRTLSSTAARPLCDSIGAAQCSVRSRRRRGDACACARTPTRIEPQRGFKMAAPEVAQWSDYRRVRRYWDVPRHLWHGTRALHRAASSAEHAQPLPQTHHTVRIELASALRAKQINVARLSIGRVCSSRAGLERSVRHCTALQASCSTGVAADAPKSLRRRTIGPSKLPAVAHN